MSTSSDAASSLADDPSRQGNRYSAVPYPDQRIHRRWIWWCLVLFAIGIAAYFTAMQVYHQVLEDRLKVLVLIHRQPPKLAIETRPRMTDEEWNAYRTMHMEMLKNPRVLMSVLAQPNISGCALVKQQRSPLDWLRRALDVSLVSADGNLIRISLRGPQTSDVADILNAIVQVYKQDVVGTDQQDKYLRIANLEKVLADIEMDLRNKKVQQRNMSELVRYDDRDLESMRHDHAEIHKALTAAHSAVLEWEVTLGGLERELKLKEVKDAPVAEADIEAELVREENALKQAGQQQLLQRLFTDAASGTPSAETALAKYKAGDAVIAELLKDRRAELRQGITDRLRAQRPIAIRKEIEALEKKIASSKTFYSLLTEESRKLETQIKRAKTGAEDVEAIASELKAKSELLTQVRRELEIQRIEVSAPVSVVVLNQATPSFP